MNITYSNLRVYFVKCFAVSREKTNHLTTYHQYSPTYTVTNVQIANNLKAIAYYEHESNSLNCVCITRYVTTNPVKFTQDF